MEKKYTLQDMLDFGEYCAREPIAVEDLKAFKEYEDNWGLWQSVKKFYTSIGEPHKVADYNTWLHETRDIGLITKHS